MGKKTVKQAEQLEEIAWKRVHEFDAQIVELKRKVRELEGFALRVRDHIPDEFAHSGDYSCLECREEAELIVGKAPE